MRQSELDRIGIILNCMVGTPKPGPCPKGRTTTEIASRVTRSNNPTAKPREKVINLKSARAKKSYNPSTKEKQDISERIEHDVTFALDSVKSGGNKPMDVVSKSGKVGFEVKTLHDAKEHRINMRPDSRKRKEAWMAGHSDEDIMAASKRVEDGKKAGKVVPFHIPNKPKESRKSVYIIAIDNRNVFQGGKHKDKYSGHKYYVYKGAKAVSLNSMTRARSLKDIKRMIGIK